MSKTHGYVEGLVGLGAGVFGLLSLVAGDYRTASTTLGVSALVLHNSYDHLKA